MVGRAAAGEFGDPMRGLAADEAQRFTEGQAAFAAVEDVADGLGPIFNGTSCAGCHNVGATGGGSETLETRFGATTAGSFDPLVELGGTLIDTSGIGVQGACNFAGEQVPPEATIVARRRTTPLFGLGLVDAVPDASLLALANREVRTQPATAGRAAFVTDITTGQVAVGRFGWKCQVPNLLQFSADAYLNEMGITTPLFPDENCPAGRLQPARLRSGSRRRRRSRGRRAVPGLHAHACSTVRSRAPAGRPRPPRLAGGVRRQPPLPAGRLRRTTRRPPCWRSCARSERCAQARIGGVRTARVNRPANRR
jgi:hypothetical protein